MCYATDTVPTAIECLVCNFLRIQLVAVPGKYLFHVQFETTRVIQLALSNPQRQPSIYGDYSFALHLRGFVQVSGEI